MENWSHTLRDPEHLWATRDSQKLRSVVQRILKGDSLVFYVTMPVGGVVGIGVAESERFTGSAPYWPDERKVGKVLYPHRFKLSIVNCLPEKLWKESALRFVEVGVRPFIRWAVNYLKEDQFKSIVQASEEKWKSDISSKLEKDIFAVQEKPQLPSLSIEELDHSSIIDMISEIGRLKGLVVEKEYPINNLRLDAAWKKVAKGNPHAAFEVQVGGNFFEALTKLKHAWDIWRSVPFLVTSDEYADKARQLVEGSFHEIRSHLRIVDYKEIKELYDAWRSIEEIERRITFSEV